MTGMRLFFLKKKDVPVVQDEDLYIHPQSKIVY